MGSKLPRFLIVDPLTAPPTPEEQKALTAEQVLLSIDARGMLPKGLNVFLGDPDQEFYFQMDGLKVCLTRFNNAPPAKTPARLAQQDRYRQGKAAWRALTEEEKQVYIQDPRAHDRRLPGHHFYMSLFLRGLI